MGIPIALISDFVKRKSPAFVQQRLFSSICSADNVAEKNVAENVGLHSVAG
jgi:hypothetical protein